MPRPSSKRKCRKVRFPRTQQNGEVGSEPRPCRSRSRWFSHAAANFGQKLFKIVQVKIDTHLIKTACLEMVTVNGRPCKIVEDSGFRKLLNPILRALSDSGSMICIKTENIREEVVLASEQNKKKEIKENIREKFILFKIDIATRMDRASS